METEPYEFPLTLRVPRTAFVVVAPEPATVTQRTVEQHFGVPPRLYKQMVRDGLFPVKRIGQLIFAAYDDVKRAVTEGAVAQARVEKAIRASVMEPEKEAPMAVEAARAYLAGARTPREQRERKNEIETKAWALMLEYDAKLNDGSPNPKQDKKLHEHGMDLLFATIGLRKKGATVTSSAPSAPGPTPGSGYYRKCCWCDRPAYATKQTWNEAERYWSGGPVCEVCAKSRADNERVVQFEGQRILLPARDPTVPTEWHRPRRRRKRT